MNPLTDDPVKSTKTEKAIDACNSLLRGEISAVETYSQAIAKFSEEPEVAVLKDIRDEHRKAVTFLQKSVHENFGLADDSSGAWGVTAKAIQATANFFGEESAIRWLQQGEALGQQAYQVAINHDSLEEEARLLIRDRLLPMINEHTVRLERLQESIAQ